MRFYKKRPLIEVVDRGPALQCDNHACDYEMEDLEGEKQLWEYIDTPCPECGENLLTQRDYDLYVRTIRVINFLNKWFSWLTVFSAPHKRKMVRATFHEELKIEDHGTENN